MLINCVAYRAGKKLADLEIESISDYLQQPDCHQRCWHFLQ